MHDLPLEILTEILKKLDPPDFYSVSLTCERWYNVTEVNYNLVLLKLCGTKDFKSAAKKIVESCHEYSIYCLECPNSKCVSLGIPKKCLKCHGKIRKDKTTL